MKIKVGYGYDVHALAEGETLWLGGIQIQHTKGTIAHSDGDVVLHAITDALLGAAGLRDIGFHFPDTDPEFKNADSKTLLLKVMRKLEEKGFVVGNVDCTISAQQPKLNPHIAEMQTVISSLLNVPTDDISIKATTTERLGFEGREEGISVAAVALIQKNN